MSTVGHRAPGQGRVWGHVVAATLSAGLLSACWSAPVQPEGALVGVRVADGGLEYWFGHECAGVAEVEMEVAGEEDTRTWSMTATGGTGTLERLVMGEPPSGFTAQDPARDVPAIGTVNVVVRGEEGTFSRISWDLADLDGGQAQQWRLPDGRWVTEDDVDDLADEGVHAPLCGFGG